jgi:hypothetical protein
VVKNSEKCGNRKVEVKIIERLKSSSVSLIITRPAPAIYCVSSWVILIVFFEELTSTASVETTSTADIIYLLWVSGR